MSRCPMTFASKYAYKAAPKQCKNEATIKTAIPISDFRQTGQFVTDINIAWICMDHFKLLHAHKQNAIQNWQKKEAETLATMNGHANHP